MSAHPAAELPANWPVVPVAQTTALLTAPGAPFELVEAKVGGVAMQVYKNAPATMRDLFLFGRASHGDKLMLVYEDERVTFEANARAAIAFAKALTERFGVVKGDRVAICMRNYPQWPVVFWACMLTGAVATPLNSWWKGEELEYGLNDCGAKLAVVDPQIFERIFEHWEALTDLETIIVARNEDEHADPRVVAMEDLIGTAKDWASLDAGAMPDVVLSADDDTTIMYSSGTTGKPKGVLASSRGIISNMFNSLANQARSFVRRGEMPPEPDPNEQQRATLLSIPFFHATGAFAVLTPAQFNGMKVVTMYKWDAGEALPIIEREKVSAIGGVPAIAWQVLEHPDREKYDLSSIQAVSYGGAPSAPELVSTIKKTFKDATPANGWGMTETCATATLNLAEDYVNRPDSAGLPGPAMKIKTVSPDGQTLPAGEVGELYCFGPSNAKLYWNRPDATAETFKDGWVATGDLARIDEEGFVYIVDRAKDMLIRGGENIYCIEVENALYEHPAVMDAAVVGIPHRVLGEEVGAVVQVKPGKETSEKDLRAFVASRLAAFKVPVRIELQPDPLPRNANGKILKNELRERFVDA